VEVVITMVREGRNKKRNEYALDMDFAFCTMAKNSNQNAVLLDGYGETVSRIGYSRSTAPTVPLRKRKSENIFRNRVHPCALKG
jgi:hypothetical protein